LKAIPWWVFSEPFSSLSHLASAVVCALLLEDLLSRCHGTWQRVLAYRVFGLGAIFLLATSGTYHSLAPGGEARAMCQRLDHCAIFVLISATFTPVLMDHYAGWTRRALMTLAWLAAGSGVVVKLVFFDVIPSWAGLIWYLALGWAGLIGGGLLARRVGVVPLLPLLWGGVAYSVGAVLDQVGWPVLWDGVVGPHEIFHVAVIAGVAFHWAFLRKSAVIYTSPA
jgi:channel protein (hemolysin III family)